VKPHSGQMELAVAELIGYRQHTIVPNVSWGLGLRHECDMLILDSQGRFTEVEIKVSKSDLKADFNKTHGHSSKIISRLVYAIPDFMLDLALELVPQGCGIIVVNAKEMNGVIYYKAKWRRIPKHNKRAEKPDQKTINKFYHLGCMRIWSLKGKLNQRNKTGK